MGELEKEFGETSMTDVIAEQRARRILGKATKRKERRKEIDWTSGNE
jgi:hypothetical protein